MARALSMTIARTHPTALAVHSGNVTRTPRPEHAGEKEWIRSSIDVCIACCSGTAATGPNSNEPVFRRRRLATNSASVCPPSNSWSKAMNASALPSGVRLNQLSPETRRSAGDRAPGSRPYAVTWSPDNSIVPKAAERVMEALDQRRQHHSRFEGALTYPKRGVVDTWTRRGRDLDSLKFTYLQPDLHKSNP